MSNIHFIKAPCNQSSRKSGFQFGCDEIKEHYDHEIPIKSFDGTIIDSVVGHRICGGYNELYKYVNQYLKHNPEKTIVTIGGDGSVSAGTVPGVNERFVKKVNNKYVSDLKILYIDAYPDIFNFKSSKNKDLHELTVSSLMGHCKPKFTQHKLLLKPNQFIFYGLQDCSDIDQLNSMEIEHYTVKKIKSIDINKLHDNIIASLGSNPVHVVLDIKVFDKTVAPATFPLTNNGLTYIEVQSLLDKIKHNIKSFDITEFNPYISQGATKITKELIKNILINTFNIKEKKINIFTEDSEFLIYRPIEQINEDDIGWYILACGTLEEREELIKNIPSDSIEIVTVENTKYYITKTTINKQNKKSYLASHNMYDMALYPHEKQIMCFKLLQ